MRVTTIGPKLLEELEDQNQFRTLEGQCQVCVWWEVLGWGVGWCWWMALMKHFSHVAVSICHIGIKLTFAANSIRHSHSSPPLLSVPARLFTSSACSSDHFLLCALSPRQPVSKPASMSSEGLGFVIQSDRICAKSLLAWMLKPWQEVHVPVCMTNVRHCARRWSLFPLKRHKSFLQRVVPSGVETRGWMLSVLCKPARVGRG